MLGHVGIIVKDMSVSKAFYEKTLAPLGYKVMHGEEGLYQGFGVDKPDFWISKGRDGAAPSTGVHIAFHADSKEKVAEFYNAALAAGAKDNGAPGPRPEYGPTYYGGFVIDPNGNNIEAVHHMSA